VHPQTATAAKLPAGVTEASVRRAIDHALDHLDTISPSALASLADDATALGLDEEGEGLLALAAANDREPFIFRRDVGLARVCSDSKGRPVIGDVDARELKHHLARSAQFVKTVVQQEKDEDGVEKRKFVNKPISPPESIVNDILGAPGWSCLPPLIAVCETPVLRPDGTIVSKHGYDRATQLYYAPEPGLAVPKIPDSPKRKDVEASLALIREAIGEFPFADGASGASFANALALFLTPVVRPMIPGNVPLAMIDKPAAGTGATLLAQALSLVVAGSTKREINATENDEEMRKAITTALSAGATVVILDNVEGGLKSSSIARVLTNDTWEDRLLGANVAVRVPNRATWLMTGNNLKLRGDIARRTYWIHLDAKVARPWRRRSFTHPDILGWTRENRGALLGAALTLARAWVIDGMPLAVGGMMGGFDQWVRTIGGILATAGVEGFLGNLDQMYADADEEDSQWEEFLLVLRGHLEHPRGALGIAQMIQDDRREFVELREKLPTQLAEKAGAKVETLATVIGQQFGKRESKRYNDAGLRIVRASYDGKKKSNLWHVLSGDEEDLRERGRERHNGSGETQQSSFMQ
jgi:hypothetical protein